MYKRNHWLVAVLLGLFSPALFALGLGGAVVKSYLDQPLDVRIELISQSGEELQSVTAGLASADDFELLGLSRAAITVPLEFELVTDTAKPYIHVTSDLKINEPVVQVLVEVVWASGRMLREYTLFLDPPTFASQAPPVALKPASKPAAVAVPATKSATPPAAPVQRTPKPAAPQPAPEQVTPQKPAPEEVTAEEVAAEEVVPEEVAAEEVTAEEVAAEEVAAEEVAAEEITPDEAVLEESATEDTDQDNALSEDSTSAESDSQTASKQETNQEETQASDLAMEDEVYGPVARGQTLWGIARDFSKGTGYSINQTMIAMQRKNPEAFIRENINSLKRGAILRLPAFSEIGELTSREAMLEVMRQEQEARTGIRSTAPDFSTPTVADSGDYQESVTEQAPETGIEEDTGHLELVPPAEKDSQDSALPEQEPEPGVSNDAILEELSRTEEELVNARQENTYLTQRIQELEADVKAKSDPPIGVEDPGLANLESNLARQRASDKPETPIAITPGGETQAWYAGKTGLIAGVAIALIALIVWALRRRSAIKPEGESAGVVAAIAVEAEEILQTRDQAEDEGETVVQRMPEPEPEPEPEPILYTPDMDEAETVVQLTPGFVPEPEPEPEPAAGFEIGFADDDDTWEDTGSADENDPEIKLDLARAYLSLGDKEASKSMLDEVLKSGNEKQKAEARQMLDEL